jgi:hypothetical protein
MNTCSTYSSLRHIARNVFFPACTTGPTDNHKNHYLPLTTMTTPVLAIRPGYSPPCPLRDALEAWGASSAAARGYQRDAWAFLSGNAEFSEGGCCQPPQAHFVQGHFVHTQWG